MAWRAIHAGLFRLGSKRQAGIAARCLVLRESSVDLVSGYEPVFTKNSIEKVMAVLGQRVSQRLARERLQTPGRPVKSSTGSL